RRSGDDRPQRRDRAAQPPGRLLRGRGLHQARPRRGPRRAGGRDRPPRHRRGRAGGGGKPGAHRPSRGQRKRRLPRGEPGALAAGAGLPAAAARTTQAGPPAEEADRGAREAMMMETEGDFRRILEILPHRYPFLLVDRIVEVEPGARILAYKNVSFNEPFFDGHFPGIPVMPGVLMLEALAQAGAILAFLTEPANLETKVMYLAGIEGVRFKRPVRPGDRLDLE